MNHERMARMKLQMMQQEITQYFQEIEKARQEAREYYKATRKKRGKGKLDSNGSSSSDYFENSSDDEKIKQFMLKKKGMEKKQTKAIDYVDEDNSQINLMTSFDSSPTGMKSF